MRMMQRRSRPSVESEIPLGSNASIALRIATKTDDDAALSTCPAVQEDLSHAHTSLPDAPNRRAGCKRGNDRMAQRQSTSALI